MSVGVYYNKPHDDLFQTSTFKKDVQKVKRQLFGPFDHEAAHRFVTQELEKCCTFQSERWNFDFKNERPLSPNGVFDWRPATPIKIAPPMKKRPSSEMEFDNHDLYCLPEDICKPKPIKPAMKEDHTPLKNNHKSQSLITDFMQIKKNPSCCETTKKHTGRPNKIPRLATNELKS